MGRQNQLCASTETEALRGSLCLVEANKQQLMGATTALVGLKWALAVVTFEKARVLARASWRLIPVAVSGQPGSQTQASRARVSDARLSPVFGIKPICCRGTHRQSCNSGVRLDHPPFRVVW